MSLRPRARGEIIDIRAEIAAARTRLPHFNYIHTDRLGRVLNVVCKIHGTPILTPNTRGVLTPNAAYTEVTLELDDGSEHTTPLSNQGALASPEQLRDAYWADIAQFLRELGENGASFRALLATRRPTGIARTVPPQLQDRRGIRSSTDLRRSL